MLSWKIITKWMGANVKQDYISVLSLSQVSYQRPRPSTKVILVVTETGMSQKYCLRLAAFQYYWCTYNHGRLKRNAPMV